MKGSISVKVDGNLGAVCRDEDIGEVWPVFTGDEDCFSSESMKSVIIVEDVDSSELLGNVALAFLL